MIRVCIAGITGWTGAPVAAAVRAADDVELVAGVARTDPAHFSSVAEALDAVDADVLVDFTHASAVGPNVRAALERGVGVVVGSSGLDAEDYDAIDALARERGVGVIAAGNFSVSAALVLRFATEAARHFDTWEVIDYASAGKQDAPSGTARELAERLDDGAPARPATFPSTTCSARGRHEARPSRARRCTRSDCRASSSPPRSCSRAAASVSRSATTRARRRTRTWRARCSRFARVPGRIGLTRGLDRILGDDARGLTIARRTRAGIQDGCT